MGEPEDSAAHPGTPDGFERLWTPHRMTYISGQDSPEGGYEKPAGCPFCQAPGKRGDDSLVDS